MAAIISFCGGVLSTDSDLSNFETMLLSWKDNCETEIQFFISLSCSEEARSNIEDLLLLFDEYTNLHVFFNENKKQFEHYKWLLDRTANLINDNTLVVFTNYNDIMAPYRFPQIREIYNSLRDEPTTNLVSIVLPTYCHRNDKVLYDSWNDASLHSKVSTSESKDQSDHWMYIPRVRVMKEFFSSISNNLLIDDHVDACFSKYVRTYGGGEGGSYVVETKEPMVFYRNFGYVNIQNKVAFHRQRTIFNKYKNICDLDDRNHTMLYELLDFHCASNFSFIDALAQTLKICNITVKDKNKIKPDSRARLLYRSPIKSTLIPFN